MSPVIEIRDLSRHFMTGQGLLRRRAGMKVVTALDHVNLSIEAGECLALVGPNGAGKSTLLRVLATLLAPSAGRVSVLGYDVARQRRDVRRSIGWVTGDARSFFLPVSGIDNLIFFGALQGLSKADARRRSCELLDQVGLAEWADAPVRGYSAGMSQRLAIARALLHRPPILLFDEPTSSLDLESRGQFVTLLRDVLASDRTTALIATHDAALVAAVATRTAHLDGGRVVDERLQICPVTYELIVEGLSEARLAAIGQLEFGRLRVSDLGDGFALSATIAEIVAAGGEVLAVERVSTIAGVR